MQDVLALLDPQRLAQRAGSQAAQLSSHGAGHMRGQQDVRQKVQRVSRRQHLGLGEDRKSTRLNSSHVAISYAVFCLKKKNKISVMTALMAIRHHHSCN